MKLHLSPEKGEWLECRAQIQCPYGDDHLTLKELAEAAQGLAYIGEATPVVRDTSGQVRKFEVSGDGSYSFGKRRFDSEGRLIPSAATLRSRRRRERLAEEARA